MFGLKFTQSQEVTFLLTWIAYASTYLLRKPLGVVKNDIADTLSLSKTQLGYLDLALLLPYALFQITFSSAADKFGVRATLSLGLLFSASSMVFFGRWHSFPLMLVMIFMNGASQSLAWPSCVKALGDCFKSDQFNALFGLWGTCCFAGGIIGSAVAVYLQALHPWRVAFLIPALFVGYVSVLVFIFLPKSAHQTLLPPSGKPENRTLTWMELWKIGLVKESAVATFCIKIVRYCMYMWLPMFLHQQLHYSQVEAGLCATVFEVGAVFGSALLPLILSKFFSGNTVRGTAVSIYISSFSFLIFFLSASYGQLFNMICIFMAGFTNGGVDPVLTGLIPTYLGEREKGNAKAAMSGFINGFGSVGTVLEGPVIGFIAEHFGWSSMLCLMVVISLCGGLYLQMGEKYWYNKRKFKSSLV